MMKMLPSIAMALLLSLLLPAPAHAAPVPGQVSLRTAYAVAIRDRILASWLPPPSMTSGQHCRVSITQLPGGTIVSVKLDAACQFDAAGKAALERAVLRAQPLPYKGFEAVFDRSLNIGFTAP
jgi:colicin import membrane protein